MIILKKRFRFKEGVTKVIYFHQEFFLVATSCNQLQSVILKCVLRNNLRKNEAFGIFSCRRNRPGLG